MGKRSRPSGGELKSVPLPLQVSKYKPVSLSHWGITHAQPFFPSIETMFKTEHVENTREYGLKLDDAVQTVTSTSSIVTVSGATRDVHLKQTMLVSPFKWMRGDYGSTLGLPLSQTDGKEVFDKIQSQHNAAYVGSLFSAVLSQTKCIHFPTVYGVYSGIAADHTIDVSDDYSDLVDNAWFTHNIGTTFELKLTDHLQSSESFKHTRSARPPMHIGDDDVDIGNVEQMEGVQVGETQMAGLDTVMNAADESDGDVSDSSSVSTSYVFGAKSCDCLFDDDASDDDIASSDEPFAWATLHNVPVQLTIMEKCEGTLYELMCEHNETGKHIAWITQVMFALAYAQRTIGFTHNDLHANNVMYVKTTKEELWYKLDGKVFRVPTYGCLIKIIDFERGVGSVRIAGMKHPKTFMSDHFAINEEAGGQYNVEPYYTQKHEAIKANPSFDLVRLATSLFWDFFPEGPEHEEYKSNPMFNTFVRWMTQDDGTSVFFGKTVQKHDRYHGFTLYKAIARYCKESAIPRKEIASLVPLFGVLNGAHPVDFDVVI